MLPGVRRWMTSSARAGIATLARGRAACGDRRARPGGRSRASSTPASRATRIHRSASPDASRRPAGTAVRPVDRARRDRWADRGRGTAACGFRSRELSPSWFSPATGRSEPIGGLPATAPAISSRASAAAGRCRRAPRATTECGDCAAPSLPVWFLADGARSATRVGTANQVTPAATGGAVWLTSYPPTAELGTAARTAREVGLAGLPLGPPVRLPTGSVIYREPTAACCSRRSASSRGPRPTSSGTQLTRTPAARSTTWSRPARPKSPGRRPAPRRARSRCSTWPPAGRRWSSCRRGASRLAPRSARAGVFSRSW